MARERQYYEQPDDIDEHLINFDDEALILGDEKLTLK